MMKRYDMALESFITLFAKKDKRFFILAAITFFLGIAFVLTPYGSLALYLLLIFMVVTFAKPIYSLYIIIPLVPIKSFYLIVDNPVRTDDERYVVGILFILIAFIALLLNNATRNIPPSRQDATRGRIEAPLILFLFWTLITFFWTWDIYHGLNVYILLVTGVIAMYIFQQTIHSKEDLKHIFEYMVFVGFLLAIVMFISRWHSGIVFDLPISNKMALEFTLATVDKRVGGFAPPQTAANTLAMILFVILLLFLNAGWRGRAILFLVGTFLISNILLSGSKGAVGAFVIGLCITILASPKLRKRAAAWLFSLAVLIALIYLFNMFILSEERLTASEKVSETSLTTRVEYWKSGFKLLSHSGWFGAGVGGFAKIIDPVPGAHSFYFSTLFDLGAIGLLLFVVFIGGRALKLIRSLKVCRDDFLKQSIYCMFGALATFFIHGLVETEYHFLHFWMFIGIAERITTISKTGD